MEKKVGIVKRKSASLNSKKDNNLFDLSIGAVGSDHDFGSRVQGSLLDPIPAPDLNRLFRNIHYSFFIYYLSQHK